MAILHFLSSSRVARSRSRSPGRRDRRAPSPEKRQEERDRYHPSSQSSLPRGHSRSRSPSEQKRNLLSLSGQMQTAGSSFSPYSSPRVLSQSASPASSLSHSRGCSQERDKAVSSSIVSSVQSKITQVLFFAFISNVSYAELYGLPNKCTEWSSLFLPYK
ncbi:hypothetical protein AMECASPLE_008156 [Ameca splendens]|uniref:Uncharacterized protein n=1 Tax=Ameca splendens TaxID=208324 RepID=A0ABV0XCY6_9TELE